MSCSAFRASNLTITSNVYGIDYKDSRFVRFAASIPQQERQAQQTQYGGMFALHYVSEVSWLHALAVDAGGDFQIQDNHYQRYRTIQRVRQFQLLGQDFGLNNYGGYIQIDILFVPPDIGHGKRNIVGERSRPGYADAHGVRA